MAKQAGILFTAFEPSGDALAGAVIERLGREKPELKIWALGGPKMEAAGAELLEETTQHAAMLLKAGAQVLSHRRRVKRLEGWLDEHRPCVVVPVDSPAANWSICKLVRRKLADTKIIHLVAPQLWAWAPWRIGKLRRLTDHVLCLMPFEPEWFKKRGVPATFVGHPLFEPPPNHTQLAGPVASLPGVGSPKIALLPGSRRGEVQANWPTMLGVFEILKKKYPDLRGVVAAADELRARWVRQAGWQENDSANGLREESLSITTGQTDAVLAWADFVLVVSGTATLQVAAHRKPMVALYNASRWVWHLFGRWVVFTRVFTLPNLIVGAGNNSGALPVPEFVPHFGGARPVADAMRDLIESDELRRRQAEVFDQIAGFYADQSFSHAAAGVLLEAAEPLLL